MQYFEDGEREGTQAYEGHNRQFGEDGRQANEGEGRHVDGDDGIINECMALFEGYELKSDDEYFSDSELELEQVRIAKLMKGVPFKKTMSGEIKFKVGQTFDNAEQMREVFREYAIQEVVTLDRVKSDLVRQTYKCKEDRCPWRAHGSRLLDGITFKLKTLVDIHECHRIYNNKEAKKNKVSVDIQRLYKAKKRALEGLAKDHAQSFDEISAINPDAKSWLQEIEPKHWSRHAYDQVIRCDYVTNNMTEAFNSMLGTHRASSYLDLRKFIRRMVMRKFQERKKECEQWNSVLSPKVNAKILKNSKESRMLTIITVGNKEYEILGPNEGYAVNLGEYSYQCGSWQVSVIPCRHAMVAISHHCGKVEVKETVNKYVHQSLTKSAYLQTYQGMIHPIPDQKRWLEVPHCLLIEGQTEHIDPPPRIVQLGRPKIQRKREPDEGPKGGKSGTMTCNICNQVGHNKRTCKSKKNKTNETSSSHQPIQQQSTVQASSS
ncbi:hypothetical protein EZV62_011289 [Acer yangbiense]|uniref:Transposase MuDR plant domain-containing protein n=1 Tax=Acer yangbiense TaxID=1000413 RepID=A0A5C7I589_9ROSI|nr:hypothetical protein EZV62_011289 [Acer yangbiense]